MAQGVSCDPLNKRPKKRGRAAEPNVFVSGDRDSSSKPEMSTVRSGYPRDGRRGSRTILYMFLYLVHTRTWHFYGFMLSNLYNCTGKNRDASSWEIANCAQRTRTNVHVFYIRRVLLKCYVGTLKQFGIDVTSSSDNSTRSSSSISSSIRTLYQVYSTAAVAGHTRLGHMTMVTASVRVPVESFEHVYRLQGPPPGGAYGSGARAK